MLGTRVKIAQRDKMLLTMLEILGEFLTGSAGE